MHVEMDFFHIFISAQQKIHLLAMALDRLCNIPAQGLIGLIGYSYQQVATSFSEAHLQRTMRLSVLGLEQFQDG
jgi:hypothetical protein